MLCQTEGAELSERCSLLADSLAGPSVQHDVQHLDRVRDDKLVVPVLLTGGVWLASPKVCLSTCELCDWQDSELVGTENLLGSQEQGPRDSAILLIRFIDVLVRRMSMRIRNFGQLLSAGDDWEITSCEEIPRQVATRVACDRGYLSNAG